MGSSPPSSLQFGRRHFCLPTRTCATTTYVTEEVVRLAERSACLVFLIGIWEAGDRQRWMDPKGGGNFPPIFGRGFLLGFPKKGTKKDGNSWKIVAGIWIWIAFFVVVFSWCCFFIWGGNEGWRAPRPFFFGVGFLNYRLSMIHDVCGFTGTFKKTMEWDTVAPQFFLGYLPNRPTDTKAHLLFGEDDITFWSSGAMWVKGTVP